MAIYVSGWAARLHPRDRLCRTPCLIPNNRCSNNNKDSPSFAGVFPNESVAASEPKLQGGKKRMLGVWVGEGGDSGCLTEFACSRLYRMTRQGQEGSRTRLRML